MVCSVIILNWNGEDMLRQYLPSVVEYTCGEGIEVVVADNGSTDNSLALLQAEFTSVRVLPFEQNYGFAEGYNRAIEQTNAKYIVLLNSDVEVTEGWLDPLLNYMEQNKDVAAVQPKIRSWQQKHKFEHAGAAGGMIDCLGYPYCRGRMMDYVEDDEGQYETDTEDIFWASGACMCVRRELYQAVGGLDKDFFAHMEEIDLCWRLQSRGYKIGCVTQSTVYHLGGGSLGYGNAKKIYLNFRNNLLMLYKNLPLWRLLYIMPLRLVLDYVAAMVNLLKGRSGHASAIIRARLHFLKSLSLYRSKRTDNMHKMTVSYPPTIQRRSIVMDYFLFHKTR